MSKSGRMEKCLLPSVGGGSRLKQIRDQTKRRGRAAMCDIIIPTSMLLRGAVVGCLILYCRSRPSHGRFSPGVGRKDTSRKPLCPDAVCNSQSESGVMKAVTCRSMCLPWCHSRSLDCRRWSPWFGHHLARLRKCSRIVAQHTPVSLRSVRQNVGQSRTESDR